MLEKAFAKFCGRSAANPHPSTVLRPLLTPLPTLLVYGCGSYGSLDGGQTAWALNALTGDPVFKLKKSEDKEAVCVAAALEVTGP